MKSVYVCGFTTAGKRDAALGKSKVDIIKGTPQNGYVLGELCVTTQNLDVAVRYAKRQGFSLYFLLEDAAGTTKPTTDLNEARQHLESN